MKVDFKVDFEKFETIISLEYGDVFVFMSGDDQDEVFMYTSEGLVNLRNGEILYTTNYDDIPIKKINCKLVLDDKKQKKVEDE